MVSSSATISQKNKLLVVISIRLARELSIFVTMSVDCGVGDPNIISQFNSISQICVKLQDIHDYLSNSPRCDVSERVKITLVVSKKNLEVWQKTWLSEAGDSAARLERFWGKDGLV